MSSLLDYLDTKKQEINAWPQWKMKSLKDAFQLPTLQHPQSVVHMNQSWVLVEKTQPKIPRL